MPHSCRTNLAPPLDETQDDAHLPSSSHGWTTCGTAESAQTEYVARGTYPDLPGGRVWRMWRGSLVQAEEINWTLEVFLLIELM